jgi:hypothetical protein
MVKDNKKISKLVSPPVDVPETSSVPDSVVASVVGPVVGPAVVAPAVVAPAVVAPAVVAPAVVAPAVVAPAVVAKTLDLDLLIPNKYPSVFSTKYGVPPLPIVDISIYNDDLTQHEANVISEEKVHIPPPPPVLTALPAPVGPKVAEAPVVIEDANNICIPFPKSKAVDDIIFCCTM